MTIRIGALHADAWTGLVLSRRPGEGFALRFAVRTAAGTADLDDFFWLLHEAGPHEPEGRYARVAFDLDLPLGAGKETPMLDRAGRAPGMVLEWGRAGRRTVVGRVLVGFEGTLTARAYLPWDWRGRWEAAPGGAVATSATGRSSATLRLDGAFDPRPGDGPGGLDLAREVRRGDIVRFVAAIGADERAVVGVALPEVDALLDRAAADWVARRTAVEGPLAGLAASVTRNVRWMVLVQPESGRLYTPAGRRWIFPAAEERKAAGRRPEAPGRGAADRGEAGTGTTEDGTAGGADGPDAGRDHWTVFGWDSYFNALELAVDAPEAARETLLAGLRTAYPNGCVPNWRGRFGGTPDRSQPPVGSLAALSLHLRRPDPDLLERAYPRLVGWSDWWAAAHGGRPRRRPGPRGLFTWGSDLDLIDPLAPPWERGADVRQLAAWESGQDDLPTWDEAEPADTVGVLAVDPVDLNAYRVLDLECLARIADELDRPDEAAGWRREAGALRDRVNEHLWDAERETYADRRWDGSFTRCRTASHFLVLVAGIAPDGRARRMVEHLTDPRLFWGEFVVPTISRDDPRFEQQQYWRGTIWPPINYLVRLGLARYGFDAEAGEVALRGARLFLGDWRRTGLCRENFDSRTGEGGGQRHQSWGPLFALSALEELAHATPWHGLRIGGLRLPAGTEARNLDFGARGVLDVAVGPEGLRVARDGRPLVETDVPVVLREVETALAPGAGRSGRRSRSGPRGKDGGPRSAPPSGFAGHVRSEAPVVLRLHLAGERWSAEIDGERHALSNPTLRLPAGARRVEVRPAD